MSRFLPQEVIRAKRDGGTLAEADIESFIAGLTDGSVSDSQAAAFAMAVFFQGMDRAECVALTRAMTRSGRTIDWPDLDRPVLDKHSTGGVGDKVSLMLAPIVAACGGAVPMISGRGLGHTGGTLDKLDAIPGYDSTPDLETFRRAVREVGCAIIGQTGDLAPADGRLYAIRDVTATVESVPLITASILSKKLAAGLSALVMDVKVGSGAFMQDPEDARKLAESIVTVANGAGLPSRALITDMNQVLGRKVGNALEVEEALDYLTGMARDPRLDQVVTGLASELLVMGHLANNEQDAREKIAAVLNDGSAAETFARMATALGGPSGLLENRSAHLPAAPCVRPALATRAGVVARVDVRALGMAVVALGGGRSRADEAVDPAVGLTAVAGLGEEVGNERPLALVHARSEAAADAAATALRDAFQISGSALRQDAPIRARLEA